MKTNSERPHSSSTPHEPAEPSQSASPDDARAALIARLFREHNYGLIRFLTARLSSEQEAKEIAQEAYVRLLQLDQPGAISLLRAFLYKTAANLATDRLRHRQVVRLCDQRDWFELGLMPSLDTQIAAQQDASVIDNAVAELPPRCREAFLLSRLHGLGTREISRRMQVSERLIRAYLARAVLHCRERLDQAHAPGRGTSP